MTTPDNIAGIHHITAITSSAAKNLLFYQNILGLPLVKKTVNFDDPYTYHLYYGDAQGSPGTILTFFPWENLPAGRSGVGMVTAIDFTIPRDAVDFWIQRLRENDIPAKTIERFGDPVIQLTDIDGLTLELTGVDAFAPTEYWRKSPIAEEHAIKGFHSATATVASIDETRFFLTNLLGMKPANQSGNRFRFQMGDKTSPGGYYDVIIDPQAPTGRSGGGIVHHIAFRTGSDAAQANWQSTLRSSGLSVTNVRDRNYFRSIYFHAPEGILFEIATDAPGFAVDEPADELGTSLKLPTQYESMRNEIERRLPSLHPSGYTHLFRSPRSGHDDGHTLVTLHGTGGNEHDLIPLAEAVGGDSGAILSPRGNVIENGMPRFFKRVANNVFDEADVIRRAGELSTFIVSSATEYGRRADRITALGYSNGANIAAAVILLHPDVFSDAILLRPMLPLQNPALPDLRGRRILVLKGAHDTVIPVFSTNRLIEVLSAAGADLTTETIDAGHEITDQDLQTILRWLGTPLASKRPA